MKLLLLLLLLQLGWSRPAQAHWADMAAMEFDATDTTAQASLTLPTPFFAAADANRDGTLSSQELQAHQAEILALLQAHITLEINHQPVPLALQARAGILPVTAPVRGVTNLTLSWQWTHRAQFMTLRYDLFPPEAPLAHCLVSVTAQGRVASLIFDRQHARQELIAPPLGQQIASFMRMGLEHILTGYDHLLFLFALLLASSRLKYLLKIVTAFTLAHSLTLSLAVLNLVQAPARWVESLIAASIMYVVAVEVLWKRKETPWYVVSGFGLVHGLGFASILRDMSLPTTQLVTALVSFNLGIEAGQLLIVLLFWALLYTLSQKVKSYPRLQTSCAVVILLIAGYWFVSRAFLGAA